MYEYKSRTTTSNMARPGPAKKVEKSAGIQCSLLTEMVPPSAPRGGARGGARVRSLVDLRKLSSEFLKMDSRKIRMMLVKESE